MLLCNVVYLLSVALSWMAVLVYVLFVLLHIWPFVWYACLPLAVVVRFQWTRLKAGINENFCFFLFGQCPFLPTLMLLVRAFSTTCPTFKELAARRRVTENANARGAFERGANWWSTHRVDAVHWPFQYVDAGGYFRYEHPLCAIVFREIHPTLRGDFIGGLCTEMTRRGDLSMTARCENNGRLYFVVADAQPPLDPHMALCWAAS